MLWQSLQLQLAMQKWDILKHSQYLQAEQRRVRRQVRVRERGGQQEGVPLGNIRLTASAGGATTYNFRHREFLHEQYRYASRFRFGAALPPLRTTPPPELCSTLPSEHEELERRNRVETETF